MRRAAATLLGFLVAIVTGGWLTCGVGYAGFAGLLRLGGDPLNLLVRFPVAVSATASLLGWVCAHLGAAVGEAVAGRCGAPRGPEPRRAGLLRGLAAYGSGVILGWSALCLGALLALGSDFNSFTASLYMGGPTLGLLAARAILRGRPGPAPAPACPTASPGSAPASPTAPASPRPS